MNEAELKEQIAAADKSPQQIAAAVSGLPNKTLHYKPAPDKWSILEILGHWRMLRSCTHIVSGRCWPTRSR